MNVKTTHKGFPKSQLIAAVPKRGDTAHMKIELGGDGFTIYGSAQCDRQPMALVHTTGTSLPGPEHTWVFRYFEREKECNFKIKYRLQ